MIGLGLFKGLMVTLVAAIRGPVTVQYPDRHVGLPGAAKDAGLSLPQFVAKRPRDAARAVVGLAMVEDRSEQGPRVRVTETDPTCAQQAATAGYQGSTVADTAPVGDIFVTATGNLDVITIEHMRRMKDRAIVCNIGHFDSEIQVAALRNYKWHNVNPRWKKTNSPTANPRTCLPEGTWWTRACAPDHPAPILLTRAPH